MPIQAKNASEPIPGYRIRKRIGAGGYGEVWSADAPGGLQKAIKFVYGFLDDERANRELTSLNRVRGVRHPFLLSLERIEVVDGQLLIVTELADTSLKSRFEECRSAGMQGIPRDELLANLKDTADALDYMSEKHSLQHLDVKPENLLLLSGRIKVADFGLVKDIGDQSISMMGGLTPLYASPEVYDGMPSRFSDQYSLAVVYQEMLTGQMPFDGKTAAQLAMQHGSSDPDLSALPPRDRSIMRRALAKSPTQRFCSCVELINCLIKGEALEEDASPSIASIVVGQREQAPKPDAELPNAQSEEMLPSIEMPDVGLRCRPTLFLGVGGIGGKVVSTVKGRIDQRFNGRASPFQVLAVDTDYRAVNRLQNNIAGTLLAQSEVCAAPLRKPEDYRNMADSLLKWMSRRWLYNIPRSQQCEGRRPLGRLALVDHASQIFEAIHHSITAARDEDGINALSREGGLRFDNGFSVVLVGCVSGATASGMLLDLAYACRQILAGMGVQQIDIRGLLPHAVGGDQTIRQLASVNAYAFSEEWHHYSRRGYPGDQACGLKPAGANQPPFDDAYLAPIGERLSDDDFRESLDRLADYLYLDTVTTGRVFFQHCREQERMESQGRRERVYVRTFGIDRIGMEDEEWMDASVEMLARGLASYWQGRDMEEVGSSSVLMRGVSVGSALKKKDQTFSDQRTASLDELARQRAAKLALEVSVIKNAADRLLEAELGDGVATFLKRMVREVAANHRVEAGWPAKEFFGAVQGTFGDAVSLGNSAGKEPSPLETQLTDRLRSLAEACGHKAGVWLRRVVEHQDARVSGARYLTRAMLKHLQSMEENCEELIKKCQAELARCQRLLTSVEPPEDNQPARPRIPRDGELVDYARLRLDVMAYRCVARFSQLIVPFIEEADTDLRDLNKSWELAKGQLELSNERVRAGSDAARAALSYLTGAGVERLVHESRRELTELSSRNVLFDAMEQVAPNTDAATASLRRAARRALMAELQQSDVACFPESGAPPRAVRMAHGLASATPALRGCGGVQRLLVMIPEASSEKTAKSFFSTEADQSPTILRSQDEDVVICYEVGRVPLDRAAAVLAEGRRDYIDCASRVRTRVDVNWTDIRDSM